MAMVSSSRARLEVRWQDAGRAAAHVVERGAQLLDADRLEDGGADAVMLQHRDEPRLLAARDGDDRECAADGAEERASAFRQIEIDDGDGGETAHAFELEVSRNRRPSAPTGNADGRFSTAWLANR